MLNPIVRREAQTSLRNWKTFFAITVYVAFVALISVLYITVALNESYYYGFDPQTVVYLYALLSGIQFGYLFIIVPALTAGGISGERERQTLDILLTTKMTPFAIVSGKLISGMGTLLLMIIATMPVYAILFYYGGVSVFQIIGMTAFHITTAFFIGGMGIFFSTVYKRTMTALVVTYCVMGLLLFGTYIAYMVYTGLYLEGALWPEEVDYIPYVYGFLSANPGGGFFSLIDLQLGSDFFNEMTLLRWRGGPLPVAMWIVNPIVNIVLGVILLRIAANRVNPLHRWNQRPKKIKKKKEM